MFSTYDLTGELAALQNELVSELLVLRSDEEFETMPTDWLYELALVTDDITPHSYASEWIPATAPKPLHQFTGADPVIGAPGDGGITWTTQTSPPIVFLKPRAEGIPDTFREFLLAEAILDIHLAHPEHPLDFFRAEYPALHEATRDDPGLAYRLSGALCEAWCGIGRRPVFEEWSDTYPAIHDAWEDAGNRLADRILNLPAELAQGSTGFVSAAELACSGVKHGIELPPPFDALTVSAYRDHGPSFAVKWTEKTFAGFDHQS